MSERSLENLKTEFDKNGYVVIPNLFETDEIETILHFAKSDQALAAESYARKDATGGESKLAVRNDLEASSLYTAVVRAERVAGTMEHLLGDEVYHYHHKMMLKEPRVGGAWEWHQDYGYWYNNGCLYPDMASCLIAVDKATKENGCLQVLKDSHKIGRINHGTTGEQMGADMLRVDHAIKNHELVYCEMNPGDALFFHGNLLHCSSKNESENPRWSLICCYNTKHNDPFIKEGRHPNYSPLEKWPDEKVKTILTNN